MDKPKSVADRSVDTTAEAEDVQVAVLRTFPVSRRLALAFSLTAASIAASKRALARAMPGASDAERTARFVELHYGPDLASEIRDHFGVRRDSSSKRR